MKSNPLCLYATYPGLPTPPSLCVCLLSLCHLPRSPHPSLALFAFCVCLLSLCHLPRSPHPYLPLFAFCLYATDPGLPTPTSLCLPSVSMPPTQVSPPLPPSVCLLSLCHLPRSPHPYLSLFAFCLYATYPGLPTPTSLCLPSVSMPPTQVSPPLPPSVCLLSLRHLPRSPHPSLRLCLPSVFVFCLYATYPGLPTPHSLCACLLCLSSVSMPPTQVSAPLPPSVCLLSLCYLPSLPILPSVFAFCLYATYPGLPTPPSLCVCLLSLCHLPRSPNPSPSICVCLLSLCYLPRSPPPLPPSVFAFRSHCAYRFFLLCPLGSGITQRLVVLCQAVRVWTHFVPLAASRLNEPVLWRERGPPPPPPFFLSNEWKRSKSKL